MYTLILFLLLPGLDMWKYILMMEPEVVVVFLLYVVINMGLYSVVCHLSKYLAKVNR